MESKPADRIADSLRSVGTAIVATSDIDKFEP